ncbi:MAG: DNA alkylation repair protein [Propionibacterium sp.]|nr:DNA alkylation repair protein [Propionibacterium sp.]
MLDDGNGTRPAQASVPELVERIDEGLRARSRPERAAGEKAYLKSSLEHYGTSVPAVRAVVLEVIKPLHLGHDEVVALAEALWATPVHEHRQAAVEVLEFHVHDLQATDIDALERLLRESRTWALSDSLAASVVGSLVEREPDLTTTLDRWSTDEDFWLRRAAMLALLLALRRGEGDFERFGRYADAMLDEKEFFIRKAIGWVLRDTARKRPGMVFEWLLPRAHRASGVTFREAIKPMDDAQRAALMAAR